MATMETDAMSGVSPDITSPSVSPVETSTQRVRQLPICTFPMGLTHVPSFYAFRIV